MPTLQASLRLTFNNILVPTDFTGASENALAYARAFAKDYGSRIFVTHAVAPNPPIFLPMEPVPPDLDGEWADAQSELDKFYTIRFVSSRRIEWYQICLILVTRLQDISTGYNTP